MYLSPKTWQSHWWDLWWQTGDLFLENRVSEPPLSWVEIWLTIVSALVPLCRVYAGDWAGQVPFFPRLQAGPPTSGDLTVGGTTSSLRCVSLPSLTRLWAPLNMTRLEERERHSMCWLYPSTSNRGFHYLPGSSVMLIRISWLNIWNKHRQTFAFSEWVFPSL